MIPLVICCDWPGGKLCRQETFWEEGRSETPLKILLWTIQKNECTWERNFGVIFMGIWGSFESTQVTNLWHQALWDSMSLSDRRAFQRMTEEEILQCFLSGTLFRLLTLKDSVGPEQGTWKQTLTDSRCSSPCRLSLWPGHGSCRPHATYSTLWGNRIKCAADLALLSRSARVLAATVSGVQPAQLFL